MKPLPLVTLTTIVFFCLWTALLARLKGYSAACWLLGGGIAGVVILCILPPVPVVQQEQRIKGNLLGLAVSGTVSVLLLIVGCLYFRRIERSFADII